MFHHERIEQVTGTKIYFPDAYSLWQRGTNEDTNDLLRQYLPKGIDLTTVCDYPLRKVADELNDRPRECLRGRTPNQAMARWRSHLIASRFATSIGIRQAYAAIFIDEQFSNRPIYAAVGVTLEGEKDILGLRAGTGGEGAKSWMSVLTDIRNRGVDDVFFLWPAPGRRACPTSWKTSGRSRRLP